MCLFCGFLLVRSSGHPHTAANNGEHGTYGRCVDDDTYIDVYTYAYRSTYIQWNIHVDRSSVYVAEIDVSRVY